MNYKEYRGVAYGEDRQTGLKLLLSPDLSVCLNRDGSILAGRYKNTYFNGQRIFMKEKEVY